MIAITRIYDDDGHMVGEVAKHKYPPRWMWRDGIVGLIAALIAATQIFA